MKKGIVVLGLIFVLSAGLLFTGCAKQGVLDISKEPIKIGYSGVLSGEAASWGQNGLAGVTLAFKEANEAGGISGRKLDLIVEDDKIEPAVMANVFNKLINVDNVVALIDGSGSGSSSAAIPISEKAKVPTMLAFASSPSLTMLGDYSFRVYPSDSAQGSYAAEYIAQNYPAKKVAIISTKNTWGEGLDQVFVKRFKKLGGQIVFEESVLEGSKDLRTEIAKIKNSEAEIVYAPLYPTEAIALSRQMKEINFVLPIFGGDMHNGEEVITSGYADGAMYFLTKTNIPDEFVAKLHALPGFADLKVSMPAPLGYDAAKVLINALKQAGTDREAIKNALAKTSLLGVSSPVIEFDQNGDLKTAVFETRIIKDKQSVVLTK